MKTDHSIPYANIIMRCDTYIPLSCALPDGYAIRTYREHDEKAWAALETEEQDFRDIVEAECYFKKTYLFSAHTFAERCFVVTDPNDTPIGFCIAWLDKKDNHLTGSVHWLIVKEEERNKGIAKMLLAHTMQYFHDHHEFPVCLHTQPWSYPAIMLYHKAGFRLVKNDSFAEYPNEYDKAIAILKDHLSKNQIEELMHNTIGFC